MVEVSERSFELRGQTLWRSLSQEFEFSDADRELLAEACRCADEVEALTEVIDSHGRMIIGSMGQLIANPAIAERRQQQVTLQRMLKALRLTDRQSVKVGKSEMNRSKRSAGSGVRGRFEVIESVG